MAHTPDSPSHHAKGAIFFLNRQTTTTPDKPQKHGAWNCWAKEASRVHFGEPSSTYALSRRSSGFRFKKSIGGIVRSTLQPSMKNPENHVGSRADLPALPWASQVRWRTGRSIGTASDSYRPYDVGRNLKSLTNFRRKVQPRIV